MENNITSWQERSITIAKFASQFLKLQSELEPIKKEANNPFFKSKYAELSSIIEVIRPLCKKHGFIILQEPGNQNERLALTTTIMHESGEFVRSTISYPVVKQDPQGYGSAITYARRYSLQAIFCLETEDDDGNRATHTHKPSYKPQNSPISKDNDKPISEGWTGEEIVAGGKYKGQRWADLNTNYLEYLITAPKAQAETRSNATKELARRQNGEYEAINAEAEQAGAYDDTQADLYGDR